MVELKFVFSNISSGEKKKISPKRGEDSLSQANHEQKIYGEGETGKKKIPLFYKHKIRAPKYEFFWSASAFLKLPVWL